MNQPRHLLLVSAAVSFLSAAGGAEAQPENRIRTAARPIPGEFIVVLAPEQDAQAVGRETEVVHAGRVKHVYQSGLKGFAVRLPRPAAERLAADPRVHFIEEDGEVHLAQSAGTWGLDRIDQRALPLDNIYLAGATGIGVTAHVLDTGIRPSHAEFGGRASLGGDYIGDGQNGIDCHGHGTHVAGSIGGATYGVAKNITLLSHRVLDCVGSGSVSGIIAAIDAITADPRRPAVANMSLSGDVSSALDSAVRASIAAGITYVIAAGNSNSDASLESPARVREAITVAATNQSDSRASFSNFGDVVDLFAPGVGITSAWYSGDTATAKLSGTSMAAPHMAGAAALYLEIWRTATPAQVQDAVVSAATSGVVTNLGSGSPNRLLYIGSAESTPPEVAVQRPNGGERLFTGTPFTIEWTGNSTQGFSQFDVYFSIDSGATFSPVPNCVELPGSQRSCTWSQPALTQKGRIKVVGRSTAGDVGADASDANFTVVSGVGIVTVKTPNKAVNWGRGSTQTIRWSHNLGVNAYIRIELSRDGGVSFPEVLAPAVKNSSGSSGLFVWTVSGPNTQYARIRVSWTSGAARDVSDTNFIIADPYISVAAPKTSKINWGYGSTQKVSWSTNLGPSDRVDVWLSRDGGATFTSSLRTGLAATPTSTKLVTPQLSAPTSAARIRVAWSNAPLGMTVAAVNPVNFTIAPPFLVLTQPNGGETLLAGSKTTLKWNSNLGALEQARIDLSTDGGVTYATVALASTPLDGSQSVAIQSAWVTATAKFRIVWLKNSALNDASNAVFRIQ